MKIIKCASGNYMIEVPHLKDRQKAVSDPERIKNMGRFFIFPEDEAFKEIESEYIKRMAS